MENDDFGFSIVISIKLNLITTHIGWRSQTSENKVIDKNISDDLSEY